MSNLGDPYTLIFLLPLGILLTVFLIVFCSLENYKMQKEENHSGNSFREQTVKWRNPQIVKIQQGKFEDKTTPKELYLLILKNIGDIPANHVRIWDISRSREIRPKSNGIKFPPVNGWETGINIYSQESGEFVFHNPPSDCGFWVEWKEKGIKRTKKLSPGEHKTFSVLENSL